MYILLFIIGILFMMAGLYINSLKTRSSGGKTLSYKEIENLNNLSSQVSNIEKTLKKDIEFKVDTNRALRDMDLEEDALITMDEQVGKSKGEILLLQKLKEEFRD